MTQKISLLLADVDGTLVTKEKLLTERALKAVSDLKDRGIKFAITSGRPPRGMAMLVKPLQIETPLAGFNGGALANPDLSIIEDHALEPQLARQVHDIIVSHKLDVWVYTENDWFIHDPEAPHAAREQRTVQFAPTIVKSFDEQLNEAVKIVAVCDDKEAIAACEKAVQQAIAGEASAALSQPYYLDITHKDANKGWVVGYLAKTYSISTDEIATIGDMANDVIMFQKSGLSIAMGNASDQVKQAATYTTDSNEEDGFAKAIEKYLLNS